MRIFANPDELLELCPVCEGDEDGCVWCDGFGYTAHSCDGDCDEA